MLVFLNGVKLNRRVYREQERWDYFVVGEDDAALDLRLDKIVLASPIKKDDSLSIVSTSHTADRPLNLKEEVFYECDGKSCGVLIPVLYINDDWYGFEDFISASASHISSYFVSKSYCRKCAKKKLAGFIQNVQTKIRESREDVKRLNTVYRWLRRKRPEPNLKLLLELEPRLIIGIHQRVQSSQGGHVLYKAILLWLRKVRKKTFG